MRFLIFDETISGHHLEYVHHLYDMAVGDSANDYIFLLPTQFEEAKKCLQWKPAVNIKFELFDDKLLRPSKGGLLGVLQRSKKRCSLVREYVLRYKTDKVFSNNIMIFVPFGALLLPKNTSLVGIIYKIYLYDRKNVSRLSKLSNYIKYKILSISKVYNKVLILNDERSANELNHMFKSQKFAALVDPYNPIADTSTSCFREEYGILDDKILFSHFGGLAKRKGTLEILKSIQLLSAEECDKYAFAFVGKIDDGIKEEFYKLYSVLKNKTQIVLIDAFCPYEMLSSLCKASDALLCPYLETSCSSGLIGFASQYHKPVIAPKTGLLGYIVDKFKLGYLMEISTSDELVVGYKAIWHKEISAPTSYYIEQNSVENFNNTILSFLRVDKNV